MPIAVWGALLVLVLVRSGSSSLSAMAGIGLVAVASAAVAVAQIPPTEQFGVVAQNYYWLWPVGVFAALTVVGAALRAPVARLATHGVAPLAVDGSACRRGRRSGRWRCCVRRTSYPRHAPSGRSAASWPGR